MKRILSLISVCLFVSYSWCLGASFEPIRVKAGLSSHRIRIGDTVKLTISIYAKNDIEVDLSDSSKALAAFTIKDSQTRRYQIFGTKRIVQMFLLSVYSSGSVTIPKLTIKYRDKGTGNWKEIDSPQQKIEVKSVLEKVGTGAAPRDIDGPVEVSSPMRSSLGLVIILVLLSALIAGISIFLRQRKLHAAQLPLRPAYEIALAQLEALGKKNLIARGLIKEYFIEISDIIRHYLENRFNLHAPEMTTEEFLVYVKEYGQLSDQHKVLLKEFLLACDLVKFARYSPSQGEIGSVYEAAARFIEQSGAPSA